MSDMTVTARLVADSTQWVAGFKRADAAAKKSAATAATASRQTTQAQAAQGAAIRGGGIMALAAGAAVAAYATKSVKAFADTAVAGIKTQRAMGGTIESATQYSAAAKLAGVDSEAFTKSLNLMSRRLVAANDGGAKAAEMAATLGTSFVGANGDVRNLGEILPGVADKFKAMKDGPEETALAMQLFGRAGAQMLPFLNRGSAGIEELKAKAQELGVVLDQEGIAKFAAYRKSTREFDMAMQGMQVTLGSELIPAATSGMNALNGLASVFGKIPGPIKAATAAVLGYAAASALLGPRLGSIASGFTGAGRAAANSVRGMASAAAMAKTLATGTLLAEATTTGLATATGSLGKNASAAKGGLSAASGGTLAFAAAAAAAGMAVSGFTGKILAGQGSLGTITTGALAMVPGFNAIGLAVGRSMGQVDKFGESEVPISAVADSLRKLNAEPQRLAESWSKMTANMDSSQIDSAKSKLVELGVNLDGVAEAADEASAAQAELSAEIAKYQSLTAQSTAVSFRQDLMQLKDSLQQSSGAFNNSKAGLDNQSKALSMASGMARTYDQQMKQLADAGQESGPAADRATAAYVRQMTSLAQVIPKTAAGKQAIDGINQAMQGVPGWKAIDITAPGIDATRTKIEQLAQRVGMTPKQLRVAVTQAGADASGAKIAELARKVGVAPKRLRMLIETTGVEKATTDASNAGKKAATSLAAGTAGGKSKANAAGRTVGAAVGQGASTQASAAATTGQQIGQALNMGVIAGISGSLGAAIGAATNAGAQVAAAYKSAADVHSPSRITEYVGQMLNRGLVVGIESTAASALSAARAVSSSVAGVYANSGAAVAAAQAKSWQDFADSRQQEAMNKTGKWKWEGRGKSRKKVWKEGPSSGKGDAWRAGVEAARDYASGIASAAAEAAKAAADLRISVADNLTSSAKGDWSAAKTSGSAKAWMANQLKTVLNFGANLKTLASRGLPQSMLQSMISKGIDAAPLAASLAKASAADFNQIASQGAALDLASANLGAIGSSLYSDRAAAAGITARQGSGVGTIAVYIGGEKINEIVGVEVDGQVRNLASQLVYG